MPDRTNDSKAQSKIPQEIYNAFLDWMRQSPKYSFQYSLYKLTNQLKNDAALKDNPYFRQFLVERNLWQPAYLKEFGITQPLPLQSPGTEATMRQRAEEWKAAQAAGATPKMFQGFTPEEWALGIPGFQLDQQQAAEARRQFDIQFGQRQSDIMNQQRANELAGQATAAQNVAQLTFGSGLGESSERRAQNAYKAQLAKQFDETIRDILSSSAPRDWVIRAKAQQALQNNPFAPDEAAQSFGTQFSNAAGDLAQEESDLAKLEAMRKDPNVDTSTRQFQNEYAAKIARVEMAKVIRDRKRKEFADSDELAAAGNVLSESGEIVFDPKKTPFGNREIGIATVESKPWKPSIPKELQQAFGITEFGQTPLRPSGQQWNRATFTAREQLAGYNEALGANWTDVLDQMAMERPQNLTLGRTWQPARSMI